MAATYVLLFGYCALLTQRSYNAPPQSLQENSALKTFWTGHCWKTLSSIGLLLCQGIIVLALALHYMHNQMPPFLLLLLTCFGIVPISYAVSILFAHKKKETNQASKSRYAWVRKLLHLRSLFKRNFSVGGSHFLHFRALTEITEISLQAGALFGGLRENDSMITLLTSALLAINCMMSPILLAKHQTVAVILFDAIFDVGYFVLVSS